MQQHTVIIVPGIPAFSIFLKILTSWFRLIGLIPVVLDIHWTDTSSNFKQKIQPLFNLIDTSSQNGNVSLIGISAGGSAVLNAFCQRKNSVQEVVTICSRLGKEKGTLSTNMKKYPSFRESIELLEQSKLLLSPADKRKILTIRSIFDEKMSSSLMILEGAQQSTIFMVFHVLIIFFALSFFSNSVITFLKKPTYS